MNENKTREREIKSKGLELIERKNKAPRVIYIQCRKGGEQIASTLPSMLSLRLVCHPEARPRACKAVLYIRDRVRLLAALL